MSYRKKTLLELDLHHLVMQTGNEGNHLSSPPATLSPLNLFNCDLIALWALWSSLLFSRMDAQICHPISHPLPTKGRRCTLVAAAPSLTAGTALLHSAAPQILDILMKNTCTSTSLAELVSWLQMQRLFHVHILYLHLFFCICLKDTPCHTDKQSQSRSTLPKIRYTLLGSIISRLQFSVLLKRKGSLPPQTSCFHSVDSLEPQVDLPFPIHAADTLSSVKVAPHTDD